MSARPREDDLSSSLDRLEERISFLVERHEELGDELRELTEARERLPEGMDPVALGERLRSLETENDRLSKHAAFLESRIRELLSRVRYVAGR